MTLTVDIRTQDMNRVVIHPKNFEFEGTWYTSEYDANRKMLVVTVYGEVESTKGLTRMNTGNTKLPYIIRTGNALAGGYFASYQNQSDVPVAVSSLGNNVFVYDIPFDLIEDPSMKDRLSKYYQSRNQNKRGKTSYSKIKAKAVPLEAVKPVETAPTVSDSNAQTVSVKLFADLQKFGYKLLAGKVSVKDLDGNIVELNII